VEYWYADAEEKARVWDIGYIKKNLQSARFVKLDNIGHGGMASTQPRKMADMLSSVIRHHALDGNRNLQR
jgi:hypothetical protein